MRTLRCLGWFGILFIVAVMACTTTGPPRDLILRDDHRGLASWYEQEAATLRGKADEMRRMAEEYSKPTYVPSPKQTKEDLIAHCQLFIKLYTEAAREADTLAHLHRDLQRGAP